MMKPTPDIRNRGDSIPLADLAGRGGDCGRPSFRALSQDYLANEAPRHFAQEAMLFFIMMMTVVLPLLNASAAVLEIDPHLMTFQL
jgi:hypothetical protein